MNYTTEAARWRVDKFYVEMYYDIFSDTPTSVYSSESFKEALAEAFYATTNYDDFLKNITDKMKNIGKDIFHNSLSEWQMEEGLKKARKSAFRIESYTELVYYDKYEKILKENPNFVELFDTNRISFHFIQGKIEFESLGDERMFRRNYFAESITLKRVKNNNKSILTNDVQADIELCIQKLIEVLENEQNAKRKNIERRLEETDERALPVIKHFFTSSDEEIQPLDDNGFVRRADIKVREKPDYWVSQLDTKLDELHHLAKELGGANQDFYNATTAMRNAYLATIAEAKRYLNGKFKLWADSDRLVEMFGEEMQTFENSLRNGDYAKKNKIKTKRGKNNEYSKSYTAKCRYC